MRATPGTRLLKQRKIPFEAREYDMKIKGAGAAAEALSWPLAAMVKTLVVFLDEKGSKGRFVLCCMPGDQELSLKKLARQAGAKGGRMSTQDEAEKQTGYLVGGIGPFGVRKAMDVWFHESIAGLEGMGINGGRRGLILFLEPGAAIRELKAQVADLATDTGGS